ncbi:hypothetical protein OF83DRAFT_1106517 [Amylostereum chailletii]|nr:hypothetical protein OF83DRAFT_1106517 [Amylostereum chailletii]
MDGPSYKSPSQLLEALVEERVAKLREITERRNVLLREMFQLIQRRKTIDMSTETREEDVEMKEFLERLDLSKYPDTGSISTLTEEELTVLPLSVSREPSPVSVSPAGPPYSEPVTQPAPSEPRHSPPASVPSPGEPMDLEDGDSSMSESPKSFPHPSPPPDELVAPTEKDESMEHALEEEVTEPPSRPHEDPDNSQQSLRDVSPKTRSPSPVEGERFNLGSEDIVEQSVTLAPGSHLPSMSPVSGPCVVPDAAEAELMSLASAPAEETFPSPIQSSPMVLADVSDDLLPQPEMDTTMDISTGPPPGITALPPEAFMLPIRKPASITVNSTFIPIPQPEKFEFSEKSESEAAALPSRSQYQMAFKLDRKYAFPPLKALPLEYQRRGKLNKLQRKREKGKDRGEKGMEKADGRKEGKDDWTPLGANRWNATLHANPLWMKVSRVTKTMSTRDWGVVFTELRYTRALERIEILKQEGKWSYRQPKKQRGVGGLAKTHWDFLLDEMTWMRTDFREERKWKLALAYELSSAVLEWHKAGSRDERKELGIIVSWSRPPQRDSPPVDDEGPSIQDDPMVIDESRPDSSLLEVDYASDDSDDDQDPDKQDVVDALETSAMLNEALDNLEYDAAELTQPSTQFDVQPKVEDVEDSSNLPSNIPTVPMEVEPHDPDTSDGPTQGQTPNPDFEIVSGLKDSSDDPLLAAETGKEMQEPQPEPPIAVASNKAKVNAYAPLRSYVAYSDESTLFLTLDDISTVHKAQNALPLNEGQPDPPPPPTDIEDLFPDIHAYNFFDLTPTTGSQDSKKKSERKDRDDPLKRVEPTTYNKLTPIGIFTRQRPTLLGPLRPSAHWHHEQWTGFDDVSISVDFDAPMKPPDTTMGLFDYGKPVLDDDSVLPSAPRDPAKRFIDANWSNQDDLLLKRLVEKYPRNWGLIAETFNSMRGAISTERRLDWECKERFKARWGRERTDERIAPIQETPAAASTSTRPAQMTTRKRLASISTPAPNGSPGPLPGNEPRKRRRHALLYESIRKYVKKRESNAKAAAANARTKSSGMHDTHGQMHKLPKFGPMELSRKKAEKEAREHEIMARRREELRQQQQQRIAQQV